MTALKCPVYWQLGGNIPLNVRVAIQLCNWLQPKFYLIIELKTPPEDLTVKYF
ncbi:MAG: hypothetical protein H7X71_01225 [Chitinophagales bacterium]|nr:hypothetical protein [Chitinophagales bacterium]